MSDENDSNTTGGATDAPATTEARVTFTAEQQAVVDRLVGAARVGARKGSTAAASTGDDRMLRLEAAMAANLEATAALTKAIAPSTTPVSAPHIAAAAPHAPTGPVNQMTTGGLMDLGALSHAQLNQLGPSGVRAELDKIRAYSHQSSGLARLPRTPERK